MRKTWKTASHSPQRLCENGYVPRPSGGPQGRGIASNLSKYAPTDLFWCIEHLLSAWCSAGTCWKTSNMRKTRKNRLPQPSGYVKNGYVTRPAGGSQGRGIASNLSKYAPTDLFWCIEHLLSVRCSAGTCWKTSKMRKNGKTASHSPLPRGCVKNVLSRGQKEPLHTEDLKTFKFSHHILFCFIIPNDFAVRGRW